MTERQNIHSLIELLHIGLNTGEYHVLGQVMLENHILNFTAEFSISNQQQHSIWKVSNDLFKHLNQKAVIFCSANLPIWPITNASLSIAYFCGYILYLMPK